MCGFNGKEDTTKLNPDRKGFRHNLPTMVGILLILVTTISISYSFPVSAILNPQMAGAAAIPPAHTSVKVQHTSSSQLMHLQFFPSNSDSFARRVAFMQFPSSRLPVPIAVAPFPTNTLIPQNPFNAMTAAAATLSNPLVSIVTNQIVPTIQGTTNNGFVSYLCPGSTVQTTPSPSLLNFGAATSTYNSIVPIASNFPSIPLTGTFSLYNPLLTGGTVPIVTGQINSGTLSGNSFTLQGTLTTSGVSGIGAVCNGVAASTFFPFAFNTFTISGTCGTNFPLAFAIDRSVIGAFNARVACNSF